MTTTETDTKTALAAELAAGLRALADMVEANPDIDPAYAHGFHSLHFWSPDNAEEMAAIARAALRHGAKVDKDISDAMYNLVISFGPLKLMALGTREQVCTRVQVGEETITRTVKDPEAVDAALADIPEVEVTETVPKYEWKCEPLMGHATEAVA